MNRHSTAIALTLVAAIVLVPVEPVSAEPASLRWVVEGIDYANFSYEALGSGTGSAAPRLVRGRYKGEIKGNRAMDCGLTGLIRTDLNWDGAEDAVVTIACNGVRHIPREPPIRFGDVYSLAFLSTDAGPREVLSGFCDGAHGFEWSTEATVTVDNGTLVCVSIMSGDCPTEASISTWDWQDSASALVRTAVRYWGYECAEPLFEALASTSGLGREPGSSDLAALCSEQPQRCIDPEVPGDVGCVAYHEAMVQVEAGRKALKLQDVQAARTHARAASNLSESAAEFLEMEIKQEVSAVRCRYAEAMAGVARKYADARAYSDALKAAQEAVALCPSEQLSNLYTVIAIKNREMMHAEAIRNSGLARKCNQEANSCNQRGWACLKGAANTRQAEMCEATRQRCHRSARDTCTPPPRRPPPFVRQPTRPDPEWLEDMSGKDPIENEGPEAPWRGGRANGVARLNIASGVSSGGCDKGDIAKNVRASARDVRACYEAQLMSKSGLEGKITVQWTIGTDGGVEDPKTVNDSLGSDAVTDCLLDVIGSLTFAEPEAGSCVVQWPFVFSPG